MRGNRTGNPAALAAAVGLCAVLTGVTPAVAGEAGECEQEFPSTFALIQKAIFENRGCTSATCHDASRSGGLDLRAEFAYDSLVSQPAESVPGAIRVLPGQRDRSLLFLNVAAATFPEQYEAPLRAMPLGLPALSTDEIEALRKWIESGAPREGTVAGTGELLNACLPPPKPIAIEPLPPPPAGLGVQIRMPKWILPTKTETEVCFASYYDVTEQVPEQFRGENGTFRYKQSQIRQDPLSHHLIVNLYTGAEAPNDPVWGGFKCRGGEKDGQSCDPMALGFCGASAECGNEPLKSIACIGQPNLPPDSGTGINSSGFVGTQETATTITYSPGVFAELPLRGMIIWNSHAFNLTDEDGKLEAWLNFEFAAPEEQRFPLEGIFDTGRLFGMQVPAFRAQEVCNIHELPASARLFEISSHMHQRGKRFRTFDGAWRCDGGPNAGAPCAPFGPDAAFETPDICAGATCRSVLTPSGGDCDADMLVTIAELVRIVAIALGNAGVDQCLRADGDENGAITVEEIVRGVRSASEAGDRDPDASLLYTSFIYNDPIVLQFKPPRAVGGTHSLPDERSLTYCALYDNGFVDPAKVKRKSTSPPTPIGIPGLFGGPCVTPTGCTDGNVGAECAGASAAQRNQSCDTPGGPGGDGVCDACPLLGGVTTEDEMFLLLGSYFVDR